MATTDFSIFNNAIQVTIGTRKKLYFTSPTTVEPNGDGTKLNIIFSNPRPALPTVYELLLTDLRVSGSGSAPADMAAALTALSSVFPKGNSSSAGSGVSVADYTAMLAVALPLTGFKMVQVISDSVNMGGTEGVYQIWPNGSRYQIAANKQ